MSISRRELVALLGSGTALAAVGSGVGSETVEGGGRICYQLYSSRKYGPLASTLAMLAAVGYDHVEGGDALFLDRPALSETEELLSEFGLTMPSAHIGLRMLESEPDWTVGVCRLLGVQTMYCAWLPPDERPTTAAGYVEFGRRLRAAGRPLREAGIGFGWHNHGFEFAAVSGGVVPLVAMFDGSPDLEWQADIGWIVRGGADPFRWIDHFRERLTSVHVKDVAAPGENAAEDGWADVGAGIVRWDTLMPELRRAPVRTYVVEHDNPSDDERFARASLAAMRSF